MSKDLFLWTFYGNRCKMKRILTCKGEIRMKRIISFLLAIVMVFSFCIQFPDIASAQVQNNKALPNVGEEIDGFKVVEIGTMDLVNAKTVLFEHKKTGAKLIYVQNNDNNRTFQISFKTPATDNTGVNHIIEHSVISGSEKYPMKNVMFTLANQTYCTFINAFTSQTATSYPVSSMSEEQLLRLADVYLDCTFNPSVYKNKNIFNREAWRFEINDKSNPLALTGTVYNEMKGNMSNMAFAASMNVRKALFPNSVQSTISGGDPEFIKDLTYENLLKTHSTYYHPSNSLMVLYGNLDYEKFLKLIDQGYLSKYDKKDIKIDTGKVQPFTSYVEKEYKYPVEANAKTKNAAQINYSFALSDISNTDVIGIAILCDLLNSESSVLKQEFKNKNIGGSISVSFEPSSVQPVVNFIVQNADPSKKAELKEIVEKTLENISLNGFDKDAIDAIVSQYILSNSNLTESSNVGMMIASVYSNWWGNYNDLNYLNEFIKYIKDIQGEVKNNYLERLVEKYIVKNTHAALVTTNPEAGLLEKNEQKLVEDLAKVKASMSSEQLDSIVASTKDFSEWNNREENQDSLIKKVQVITPSTLPEEIKQYNMKDKNINQIRLVTTEANVAETYTTSLLLDTSGVAVDRLHFLELYSELLGKISTKNYNQQKLSSVKMRYLNGASFGIQALTQKDNKYTPYLILSWLGLIDNYDSSLELVKEILLNTDFTNTEEIKVYVKNRISEFKYTFENNPLSLQVVRSFATNSSSANYYNYVTGIDYYNFLKQVEQMLDSNPKVISEELEAVSNKVANKKNAVLLFAGNKNNIDTYEKNIEVLTDSLKYQEFVPQDYSLIPPPASSEGIIVNSSVQYNMMSANYEKMGTKYSGKFLPIGKLIYDGYLTPKIRFGNGAYDNLINFNEDIFFMLSYRDPKVKETYDIFKALPEFLKNTKITQEELDRYIISIYGQSTVPTGELSGATTQMINYLQGKTVDDTLKMLKEIKSTTVQDVKDMGLLMEQFMKNASISTVGSEKMIKENTGILKSILSIESGNPKGLTRGELIKALIPNVENPEQIAISQGIIKGDGNGNYNLEEVLSKQELAVIISRIVDASILKTPNKGANISDISSVDAWAKDAVTMTVETGIIGLNEAGNFEPTSEINNGYLQEIFININKIMSEK